MEIIPAKSSSMSRDCCLPHAKRWPRKTLLFTLVFEQLHMLKHCKYGGPNTFVISAVYFYFYNHDLNVITSHVEEDVKNIASSCGFSGKESCESCPANAVPSPDPWHRSSTVLSTNCLLFHSSRVATVQGSLSFLLQWCRLEPPKNINHARVCFEISNGGSGNCDCMIPMKTTLCVWCLVQICTVSIPFSCDVVFLIAAVVLIVSSTIWRCPKMGVSANHPKNRPF